MDEFVDFEAVGTSEAFPAHAAHEELDARVPKCVAMQVSCQPKAVATYFTAVWFLPGVNHGVPLQLPLLDEGFVAHLTLKRTLSSVDAAVGRQAHRLAKSLATKVTAVGAHAAVDPLMVLEADGLLEGHGAVLALVHFLPRVNKFVAFKVVGTSETFPAHVTRKKLGAGVRECVAVQVPPKSEVFTADLTAVWFLTGVNQTVPLQQPLLGESLSTL